MQSIPEDAEIRKNGFLNRLSENRFENEIEVFENFFIRMGRKKKYYTVEEVKEMVSLHMKEESERREWYMGFPEDSPERKLMKERDEALKEYFRIQSMTPMEALFYESELIKELDEKFIPEYERYMEAKKRYVKLQKKYEKTYLLREK